MRRMLVLLPVLVGLAAAPISATVVAPAELSELAAEADAIVHGRVVAVAPQWVDGRRSIETLVTLVVEDALKGPSVRELTFRVPGGQMGPYRSIMVGAPTFGDRDEVIVFLGARGPAIPHVLGFNQGVYRVGVDALGAKRVVSGAALAAFGTAERLTRGVAGRQPQPLDIFLDQVRTLVRQGERR